MPSVIDTIGWDCYNKSFSKGSYGDPATMLGKAVATSKARRGQLGRRGAGQQDGLR